MARKQSAAGVLGVLILCVVVACLAGCQLPGTSATPTATATEWQALHRPLHLPTVASGAPCPAAQEHAVSPDPHTLTLGDGPVYPVAPWVHGTYAIDGAGNKEGWYELKVPWFSQPEYTGPVLIRGRQVDGPNALLFGIGGQELLADLKLPAGSSGSSLDGWRIWPSFTMPHAPGCYAYQVDGLSFSAVIVFRVVP